MVTYSTDNKVKLIALEVPTEEIIVNPFQPRRFFDEEELGELAESIRAMGIIQPLIVRKNDSQGCYEIIAGERRFRAAQLAGLKKIPVVVRDSTSYQSAEMALVENIQRVDLNPIEIAESLRALKELGFTQSELGERVGIKRPTLANYLRLLDLPKEVREHVKQGRITMGHAKALAALDDPLQQVTLADQVVRDLWSVRQTEEAIQRHVPPTEGKMRAATKPDVHIEHLAKQLQEKLGTKVTISGGDRGKISIDYYSLDDLDRILETFG